MTIQTNRTRTGDFATVKPEVLATATGFDGNVGQDIAALYYHTTECYPAQDWRLVDDLGIVIDEFDA